MRERRQRRHVTWSGAVGKRRLATKPPATWSGAGPGLPWVGGATGDAMQRVIFSADDFGLTESVNEAVERAHREGALTGASLMVAGPAAADAVRRARVLPSLRVGLHLVVIEGPAVLPPSEIP